MSDRDILYRGLSVSESTKELGEYTYEGGKVDISKHRYDLKTLYKLKKPVGQTNGFQGSACYGDELFVFFHEGGAAVYDLDSGSSVPKSSFSLDSAGPTNHANCANFSNVFHEGNTDYPLLYVTSTGNDAPEEMKCSVENITKTGGVFSSENVQEIHLTNDGFADAGLLEVWGWPNWLVDAENGYLYAFSAKFRTSQSQYYDQNVYIANKFKLPKVSDGAVITLGVDDLIEQKTFEYNVQVTQAGTIFNNKIFYTFGWGTIWSPFKIGVYDLLSNSLYASITPIGIDEEPESCFVYDGKLMVIMAYGDLLEFTF